MLAFEIDIVMDINVFSVFGHGKSCLLLEFVDRYKTTVAHAQQLLLLIIPCLCVSVVFCCLLLSSVIFCCLL